MMNRPAANTIKIEDVIQQVAKQHNIKHGGEENPKNMLVWEAVNSTAETLAKNLGFPPESFAGLDRVIVGSQLHKTVEYMIGVAYKRIDNPKVYPR